jgi:uncharacterized heparinase superfamily protein
MAVSLARLYHTVRPLRAAQVTGRVRRHVRALLEDPAGFAARPVPAGGACRWRPRAGFLAPGGHDHDAAALARGRFRFVGESVELGWPPRWEDAVPSPLWRYNLHYFEWLWALSFEQARDVVRDWIARQPLARGRVGWAAYPTSLRLASWCSLFFGRFAARTEADARFRGELWASISLQADWLAGHLETHLLGNHLFENAAALALCGSCFDGPAAERWRRTGLELLRAEIPEQVLADGGHFERSPMYHARIAYLLIALLDCGDEELASLVEEPAVRMLDALERMSHPDGEIALLNDSALRIANRPAELRGWWSRVAGRAPAAGAPAPGPFALPDTGYYGARGAEGHALICDAGPLGPDHLLGHAHADIFSFELSFRGRRVVADTGVHGYDGDPLRDACRATHAHSTVEVEGEDQCEFWAVFRVARRGRPRDVVFEPGPDGFRLSGWHDGYTRLPGRPRHARRFTWHAPGVLLVRDEVTASRSVRVASRIHLHPDCEIEALDGRAARVHYPAGSFAVCFAGPGELSSEPSPYCPEFGSAVERRALVFRSAGERVATGFCIAEGRRELDCDLGEGARADGESFAW